MGFPKKIYSEILAGAPFLKRVVEEFVSTMPHRLRDMRRALKDSRFAELATLAHRLKGAGGTHGYPAVTEYARLLQEAALREDRTEAARRLKELQGLSERLVPEPPPQN